MSDFGPLSDHHWQCLPDLELMQLLPWLVTQKQIHCFSSPDWPRRAIITHSNSCLPQPLEARMKLKLDQWLKGLHGHTFHSTIKMPLMENAAKPGSPGTVPALVPRQRALKMVSGWPPLGLRLLLLLNLICCPNPKDPGLPMLGLVVVMTLWIPLKAACYEEFDSRSVLWHKHSLG